jgi:hypothetical protein
MASARRCDNEMISRLGQAMPRFLAGANVAGEGMRERLRATTFALFGLVTAVGLVLVGIAYNQGWPVFADSPIPGIPTERVGAAAIAADAVPGRAQSGNVPASHGSAPAGQSVFVPDRSSAPDSSSQQLPATAPGGPGQSPSGQGGVDVPASPTPTPAGQPPAAEAPAPIQPQQTAQGAAPVAASPPAAEPAGVASVPGKGKAKGREKGQGKPAPVTPVVPTSPPAAEVPAPGTPPAGGGPGNGHGKGNANGHDK